MNSNLPPHWSWVKLGDVVDNFKRGPFGSAIKKSFFVSKGYKVYEQKNAIYHTYELGNYFINEEKFQELNDFEVNPGDFIVSCSGTIGKIYRLPSNAPRGIINQALLRIRLKEQIIAEKYFIELFKSFWFQKKILVETRGSAMLNIAGVKELKQISIPLPPLHEQKKIVEKIEELFSELYNGAASLKKAKEQIKLYRQSVLAAAFSGRLLGKDDIFQKQNSKLKDVIFSGKAAEPQVKYNSQSLPDGWKWVKLGEYTESMKNGIYKPASFYSDNGIACLRMYNIKDGKIDWINIKRMNISRDEIQEYELKEGDILVNRVNSRELVGKSALIKRGLEKCIYESKNIRLRLKSELNSSYTNYWLLHFANQFFNRNAQQTVGMASINQPQLASMPIPYAPFPQQHKIVSEIEKRFSEADNLEKAIDESLQKSEALRQSILKKAFEGRLI